MPIDGVFTSKLVDELQDLKNNRITKIYQLSNWDFLFYLQKKKKKVIISSHPNFFRINHTKKEYESSGNLSKITTLFRKYLEGGIIEKIYQNEMDRVITFDIRNNNEIGDTIYISLIVELIGRHSNIILVKDNHVIDCTKHVLPFENEYRSLVPSSLYKYPDISKKCNPFINNITINELENIEDKAKYIADKYQGISKILATEIVSKSPVSESMKNVLNSFSPTIINDKYFSYTDLTHIEGQRKKYNTLSNMLDDLFYDKNNNYRIKQHTQNIVKLVKKNIIKNNEKIVKLEKQIKEAEQNNDKMKGDLLYTNYNDIPKNTVIYEAIDYNTNEPIKIKINPLISIKANANKYYQSHKKRKTSLEFLPVEIAKAKDEIKYFSLIESQIAVGSLNDIFEIIAELENQRYIKKTTKKNKTGKKKMKIKQYIIDESTIYIGKNNIQNSYLTHTYGKANDYWFHVKDAPSSHVLVRGELTENVLRTAAMLTAYYSKYKDSSSVPIDYTKVRYIKKIPGKKSCFITYSNHKTIYIDPDEEFVSALVDTVK